MDIDTINLDELKAELEHSPQLEQLLNNLIDAFQEDSTVDWMRWLEIVGQAVGKV